MERSIPGLRNGAHPLTGLPPPPEHAALERSFALDARIAPLPRYDPLADVHLQHLWRQPRMQRHMKRSGFHTSTGELMDPIAYLPQNIMVEQDMAHADKLARDRQRERELRLKEQQNYEKRAEVRRLFVEQIDAQRKRNAAIRKANAERAGLSKSTGRLPGLKKTKMNRAASSPMYQSASSLVAAARMMAGDTQQVEPPPASPSPQVPVAGVGVSGGADFLAPTQAAGEGSAPPPPVLKRTLSKETKRKAQNCLKAVNLEPFGSTDSFEGLSPAQAASPNVSSTTHVLTREKKRDAKDFLRSGPPTPAGGGSSSTDALSPSPGSSSQVLTREKKREAKDFLRSGTPTAADGDDAPSEPASPSAGSSSQVLTREKKREAKDFLRSGTPTAADGDGAPSEPASPSAGSSSQVLTREKKREAKDFLRSGPASPSGPEGGGADMAEESSNPSLFKTLTQDNNSGAGGGNMA